jgi:hypothetical protein
VPDICYWGCHVIDGFRIEMTAEELIRHLDARVQTHRDEAARCDAKRVRLETATEMAGPGADDTDQDGPMTMCWPGYLGELEHRSAHHRRREVALAFLRDHVIAHEIYRLGEMDLRLVELWPGMAVGVGPG